MPDPSRRDVVRTLAGASLGLLAAPYLNLSRFRLFADGPDYSERAVRLVRESDPVDLLNQFAFPDYSHKPPLAELWLSKPWTFTAADFALYRDSGIRVFALGHAQPSYDTAVRWFADWNGFLAAHPDWLLRVGDAGDFDALAGSDRVGILLTYQNSDHFRTPADVDTFFGLGQRLSQLTYNYQNRIGCGFLEEHDGGLTVFGAQVVERMNRVGMAVDVSHCADRTTLDTLDASRAPVVFSHASCRALMPDHPRCKTDEMIRKMAASGGVMGIPFLRFMARAREPVAVGDVLDHFDHVARLVGPEYLAVGSDMDLFGNPNPVNGGDFGAPTDTTGRPNWSRYGVHTDPEGGITIPDLDHPKRMYDLTEGLVQRGWSDDAIRGVLGANARRVLTGIWKGVASD